VAEIKENARIGGHQVLVLKMKDLPYPVTLFLQDPNKDCGNPRLIGAELDVFYYEDGKRHEALGKFLDAWGRLEQVIIVLITKLLGTSGPDTRIVFSNMGMRQVVEIIKSLSSLKLTTPSVDTLESLTDSLVQVNQTRNRLVHGHWVLEANVCVWAEKVFLRTEFSRQFRPPNPEQASQMGDIYNQRIRTQFCFSIKRIIGASKNVDALNVRFSEFQDQMQFAPDLQAPP
jgi:hypothetical protein